MAYATPKTKIMWSKASKMNKPLNKMLLRKRSYTTPTLKEAIAQAKRTYSKSKRLQIEYRPSARGGKAVSCTVYAYY